MNQLPRVGYQVFVRSFSDGNGDGIGDLKGLTNKLVYLAHLGIDVIWLSPIHPSPSYHKYDVTDYYQVDKEYGTLEDVKELVEQAHFLGMKVLLDFVIHHTSDKHPWFQASEAVGSQFRDYYYWLPQKEIKKLHIGSRKSTADTAIRLPWHGKGALKYLGIFDESMPDLRLDHLAVLEEVHQIACFWLGKMGIDGFRLDAARHIFPPWHLYKSEQFWEAFQIRLRKQFPTVLLIGEVWTNYKEIAPYFRGIDANFNFDLAEAILNLLKQEENKGFVEMLQNIYKAYENVRVDFIDAIMLSNHDQERVASVLKGNIAKIKLAASILLTLPGLPFLYYGEEIGMFGEKPDKKIREPFVWGELDTNQTCWTPMEFNKNTLSLHSQQSNAQSILWHYKSLIRLRKRYETLSKIRYPNLELIEQEDQGILAYIRNGQPSVCVVHNVTAQKKTIERSTVLAPFRRIIWTSTPQNNYTTQFLTIHPFETIILI